MMRILMSLLLACVPLGGCGGYYVLNVPDQLAPAGGEAETVVRLQRNDFFVLQLPIDQAAMRMQIDGLQQRGAYTDDLGYAGTTVPVPDAPGKYELRVSHLDGEGEEVSDTAPVYVWDPGREIVAVDVASLPLSGEKNHAARAAIKSLAEGANILYMTRESVDEHARMHEELSGAGYADGPILLWQRQRWHIVRDKKYKFPRIVVESRLVSQLAEMRDDWPNFRAGVTDSALAGRAFADAGLPVVLVGDVSLDAGEVEVIRRDSWSALADRGI